MEGVSPGEEEAAIFRNGLQSNLEATADDATLRGARLQQRQP